MSSRYDQREWARLERLRAIGYTPTGDERRGCCAARFLARWRKPRQEAATLDGEFTSTPTLAEASMSTLQATSIQAPWFPLP